MLLWLDLETTGLDPNYGKILEAAWFITQGLDQPVVRNQCVLRWRAAEQQHSIDPFVIEMHMVSGLWDECERSEMTSADLDSYLVATIETAREALDEDGTSSSATPI